MRCPTLTELPPPPAGKSGWPWTEESQQLPDTMPDGSPWPKISIVTPSYNQAQFIEATIRSVLLQSYPNLEYIVMDGGSTDNSVEIIKKYESWLAHWISEPDKGQADAINRGWHRAKGDILAWLNSDDEYCPSTLAHVAAAFHGNPHAVMIYGDCQEIDADGRPLGRKCMAGYSLEQLVLGKQMGQPSVFICRCVLQDVGYLDETMQWALDTDFFIRVWLHYPPERFAYLPSVVANSRVHPETKSNTAVERVTMDRRLVLDRVYKTEDGQARIGTLRNRAYSDTYWKQAILQHAAGQNHLARRSALIAWRIAPGAYRPLQIPKFIIRTMLPPAWVHRIRRIRRAVAVWK